VNGRAPVRLVCPRCRGALEDEDASLRCAGCSAEYPVVAGIPDLRVAPDPWIGLEDDRAKALEVDAASRGEDLEGAVRAYWRLTPSTPADQAERFVQHVLRAEGRSREWLDRTEGSRGDQPCLWLDEGCGTGDLAAAVGSAATVVGLDVALRWLVVARHRLDGAGVPAHLVCANAERLPFPDGSFDRIVSLGMLEHCADRQAAFREARRVLREPGMLRFRTANRFTVLPEPHVGVRGVGFLPRGCADPYVRWRTGRRYLHHNPAGSRQLHREMRAAGFRDVHVDAAILLPTELEALGPRARRLGPAYERIRSAPVLSLPLRWIAPLLEGRGVAG
jgi:SAM-dependent methyltransferase